MRRKKKTTQILQSSKIQRKKATFGFGNIKKEKTESRGGTGRVIRCVGRTLGRGVGVGACFLKFRISGISNVGKFNKSPDPSNIRSSLIKSSAVLFSKIWERN